MWSSLTALAVALTLQTVPPEIASGRNDVVYLAPATEPYEAMPLGNGQLGVMVGNRDGLSYLFSHGSFFSTADQDQGLNSSGELLLRLPAAWRRDFREQRLELATARVVTRYRHGTVTSWLTEGRDVLVIEVSSGEPLPAIEVALRIWERPAGQAMPVATATPGALALTTVGHGGHRATSLRLALPPDATLGAATAREVTAALPGGGTTLTLRVACPVSRGAPVTAEQALAAAAAAVAGLDLAAARAAHEAWWAAFWQRSRVVLSSPDGTAEYLENLYHLHRYWLAGCSRGPDTPKFNGANYLFANDWRSWGGAYWYQNTRELYFALLPSGDADLWAPFLDLYWRHLPAARQTARDLFGAEGAAYDETMAGHTGRGDKRGNAFTHLYMTTGPELAHQFYVYYRFTGDETFRRERAYPLLKEVTACHLAFLRRDAQGTYHVYPTNARETWHFVQDSTPDLAALRANLALLLAESAALGLDTDLRPRWQEVLDHLAPYPTDGRKVLPGTLLDEFPPTSFALAEQLYQPTEQRRSTAKRQNAFNSENAELDPVFPWGLVSADSPADQVALFRATFLARRFANWGYGNAWDCSAIWAARLAMPDEWLKSVNQFLHGAQMFPQGFAGTPGACPPEWGKKLGDSAGFDGSGVLAFAVAEALLQSHGGTIRVFPALPAGWEGEFTLHAEGGFVVQASRWGDCDVTSLTITHPRGGTARLADPWQSGQVREVVVKAGETVRVESPEGAAPCEGPVFVRQEGPKWPNRQAGESANDYLRRHRQFGFLGITRRGQNPARNAVRSALTPSRAPGATISRPPRPVAAVVRAAAPPVLDGKLDDALWQAVAPLGPLVEAGTPYAADDQTEVRLAWDDQALYLAVRCYDEQLDLLAAEPQVQEDREAFLRQDRLELSLGTAAPSYWHLVVNPAGAQLLSVVTPSHEDEGLPLGSGDQRWEVATGREGDAWTAEWRIPFAALGTTPTVGAEWLFNLGRHQPRSGVNSTWAPLTTGAFHTSAEFARLRFTAVAPEQTLLAWFDGESLTDRAGYGWEARAPRGGVTLAAGRQGQAFTCDGQGGLEVAPSPLFDLTPQFTIELWVKPGNVSTRLVDRIPAGTPDGYLFDLHPGGRLRFITPVGEVDSPAPLAPGQWHHVAAVLDSAAGKLLLYVGGIVVAEAKTAARPLTGNALPLRLGMDSNGDSRFAGQMDDVKLWREARSAAQLRAAAEAP
jgi:hypothetical protein